jgi:ATP-binding cassette subfamily B protein
MKILQLGKGLYRWMIVVAVLILFSRFTYSLVPLFTQYLLRLLLLQPGISDPDVVLNTVNLPLSFINFFEATSKVTEQIVRIAVLLILLQFVRFTFRFVELYIRGFIQHTLGQNLRLKMYQHIQSLPFKFHNNSDSGDLIQRSTSDIETTVGFISGTLMEFIFLASTLFFGAYQIFMINRFLVILSLSLLPFVGYASIWYFRKNDKMYQHIEETESEMMTIIQENLSSARIVRAFGNESYEIDKMSKKNDNHMHARIQTGKIVSRYWGIMDFLAISQYIGIVLVGVYFIQLGTMDAPQIAASLGLIGMLIWPIRGLGHMLNDYAKALASSKRIIEILELPSEYEMDGFETPDIFGHIIFENVTFKFEDTNEPLFKDISFEILPGETVAFIGRTGSGKSTLMNLLMRMYDYESGHIYVDGVELRNIKKEHIRKHLGVVLQEPFLFSKTVYENIAIADRQASRDQVIYAAQIASLERDIKTFKKGYETIVGEKGTTLSGGQKQRVAIARILVADKPILVFDDALSAVDTKTDLMIREALQKRNNSQTTLIITHRMTTAREADKIIVIDRGVVEAIGSHDQLSKQKGLYSELWKIQGKLEQDFLKSIEGGESDA